MEQQLFDFLDEQPGFSRLHELEVRHIKALFFSTQQLFAVSSYETVSEMEQQWERAAHQLAHKIQNHLPLELNDLRWDMYLIVYINQDRISNELRRLIENNRFYFRKIILTRSDMKRLTEKLPVRFELPSSGMNSENKLFFTDQQFLQELKGILSEKALHQLGGTFFSDGAKSVDELIPLFSSGNKTEDVGHEN